MQNILLPIAITTLAGCVPLAIFTPHPTSQLPMSSNCPSKSMQVLERKNVKQISLDSQVVTESQQVSAEQQVGYSFDGKTGQKFDFHTAAAVCVQVYTPSNQSLQNGELPEDGKYTVQVSVPQGSKSFTLEMKLGSTLTSQSPSLSPESSISSSIPSVSPSSLIKSISSATSKVEGDISQKAIDDMADKIFNERHPELGGRKISNDDTESGREWQQIRSCDAIVDYTFHQRHPELDGRSIGRSGSDLQNEWWNIHGEVNGC